MKLLLARHGETDWNVQKKIQGSTDIELNETGRKQAELLGQKIARQHMTIAKIYTSKLKRALKTAQIVGEMLDKQVEILDGIEEMNLGAWEGKRWSELERKASKEYLRWYQNRRYCRAPEGESYQVLLERVVPALRQIIQKEKENVLIVTHSADIVSLLAVIHGTPFADMFQLYSVGNTDVVEIDSEDIHRIRL